MATIQNQQLDSNKLLGLLNQANENILKKIKGNDIVLVLGNTGSGKSTLVNYLIGNELKYGYSETGQRFYEVIDKTSENVATIGHSIDTSETLFPQGFVDKKSNIIYCDCPGFFETRGLEENITITIGLELAIKGAKNVGGIIIVLSYHELYATRALSFKQLYKTLDKLIVNLDKLHTPLIFVISKITDPYYKPEHFLNYVQQMIDSASKNFSKEITWKVADKSEQLKDKEQIIKIMEMIKKNRNNIIICDFMSDEGKNKISNILSRKMYVPKENFNFNDFDTVRFSFNQFVHTKIAESVQTLRPIKETPASMNKIDKSISECLIKIESFRKEIFKLENVNLNNDQLNKEIEKEEYNLREKVKKINERERSISNSLRDLYTKKNDRLYQLRELESDEPYLVKNWEFFEKRTFIVGFFFRSEKDFEFNNPETPICDVYPKCGNGTFINEKLRSNEGYYRVTYRSERGKDGDANVKVYVSKKYLPENKVAISDMKRNIIPKLDEEIKRCESQKNQLEGELNIHNDYLKVLKDKSQSEQAKRESIRKKVEEFKNLINQQEKAINDLKNDKINCINLLNNAKKFCKDNKNMLDLIQFIIKSLDYNTDLSNEYTSLYQDSQNEDTNVKREISFTRENETKQSSFQLRRSLIPNRNLLAQSNYFRSNAEHETITDIDRVLNYSKPSDENKPKILPMFKIPPISRKFTDSYNDYI